VPVHSHQEQGGFTSTAIEYQVVATEHVDDDIFTFKSRPGAMRAAGGGLLVHIRSSSQTRYLLQCMMKGGGGRPGHVSPRGCQTKSEMSPPLRVCPLQRLRILFTVAMIVTRRQEQPL
jgi:hypothetical protein